MPKRFIRDMMLGIIFVIMLVTLGNCEDEPVCNQQLRMLVAQGKCPDPQATKEIAPCANPCTGALTNCTNTDHCCLQSDRCVLKVFPALIKPKPENSAEDLENSFLRTFTSEQSTGPRALVLQPGLYGGSCLKFPQSCLSSLGSSGTILPPVNIPYCQRISCAENNGFLDLNPNICLAIPGCAFDFALYLYRNAIGQGIYPAVPTCHLAVRNEIFQTRAKEYVSQSGLWNPILSNCLIKEHEKEIYGGSPGCYMIKTFEKLGHKAKRCGWEGMSPTDCYLINCCWRDDNTCIYPLSESDVTVPSEHIPTSSFSLIEEGLPMCQPMDDSLENESFLDAYHTCLTSGCASSVDRETLLQHLHGVTKSYLPYALQHQYWSMVLLGEVRPDNWRQVADKLIKDNQNSLAGIFDSLLPSNIIGGSVGTDGMSALPFTLALNITAQSSIRQPFVNYGSFGEFGIGSPLSSDGTITGRSLNLDESPEAPSRSVSIGNFGSVNPNDPDLHNSLSGFGAPIPSTIQRRNYFGCPYQPIHWPNFPSLEGSFQGCCKRPLCYLPKQAIRKTYSGLAKYDTMWSSWGPCSATCGEGKTKRNRHCVGEGCGGGYEEQIKYCMETPCPTFTPWSQYGPCSVSCGGGTKNRTRSCVGDGPCSGKLNDESPCKPGRCPTFRARPGNSWSSCSTTCGVGVQRRNIICVDPGAYGCPPVKFEEKECNKYCGRVVYNPRTCDPSTCKYTQTPRCVQRNRRPGHCPPDDMKVKTGANCFEGPCICRRFPHFCPRRPNTGSGNRNSLFDLQ